MPVGVAAKEVRMKVLGVLAVAVDPALRVVRCLVRFKWPVVAVLLLAPLAITWSPEVFALNGLGMFSWLLLVRHVLKLLGRR